MHEDWKGITHWVLIIKQLYISTKIDMHCKETKKLKNHTCTLHMRSKYKAKKQFAKHHFPQKIAQ